LFRDSGCLFWYGVFYFFLSSGEMAANETLVSSERHQMAGKAILILFDFRLISCPYDLFTDFTMSCSVPGYSYEYKNYPRRAITDARDSA